MSILISRSTKLSRNHSNESIEVWGVAVLTSSVMFMFNGATSHTSNEINHLIGCFNNRSVSLNGPHTHRNRTLNFLSVVFLQRYDQPEQSSNYLFQLSPNSIASSYQYQTQDNL